MALTPSRRELQRIDHMLRLVRKADPDHDWWNTGSWYGGVAYGLAVAAVDDHEVAVRLLRERAEMVDDQTRRDPTPGSE